MKIIKGAIGLAEFAMAFSLGTMVVLVLSNVIMRYGFNSGIAASEDIARFLFIWMTFIGAILGVKDKAHLGMDAIVKLLPRSGKLLCSVLNHFLMLGTIGMLLVGSWQQMQLNNSVMAMGAIEYPLSWMYAAGFVGSAGLGAFVLSNLVKLLSGKVSDEDLVSVQETEGLSEVDRIAADASATGKPSSLNEKGAW